MSNIPSQAGSQAKRLITELVTHQIEHEQASNEKLAKFRAEEADKAERRRSYSQMQELWKTWPQIAADYEQDDVGADQVVEFLVELVRLLEHVQQGVVATLGKEPNRFERLVDRTFIGLLGEVNEGKIEDVRVALCAAKPRPKLGSAVELDHVLVGDSHLHPTPELEIRPREEAPGGLFPRSDEHFGFRDRAEYELAKWLYERGQEKVSGKLTQAAVVEKLQEIHRERGWPFFKGREKHQDLIQLYIKRTGADPLPENKGGRPPEK